MARNSYQYTTSPRKLEPEIKRKKQNKNGNLKIVKDVPNKKSKVSDEQKKKQF